MPSTSPSFGVWQAAQPMEVNSFLPAAACSSVTPFGSFSVGRGSEHPFEQIGGVELDTARILADLQQSPLPGVRFVATTFTPHAAGDGKYNDTTLTGIRLEVTDRSSYDPTLTAVRVLGTVAGDRVHFPGFHFLPKPFRRLFGGDTLLPRQDASRAKADPQWLAQLAEFRERRRPFLLYPDE